MTNPNSQPARSASDLRPLNTLFDVLSAAAQGAAVYRVNTGDKDWPFPAYFVTAPDHFTERDVEYVTRTCVPCVIVYYVRATRLTDRLLDETFMFFEEERVFFDLPEQNVPWRAQLTVTSGTRVSTQMPHAPTLETLTALPCAPYGGRLLTDGTVTVNISDYSPVTDVYAPDDATLAAFVRRHAPPA
ncbi:hypothetical protein [Deinococcus soli (ex Cha et al. 2016)]|uniref:Uncharacterized protein n=1 Tax=Deinococcus soli (ex Cha et al. 2016) TaxID=1309411 RepID=A0ACC6KKE0_9DEIO|nr:hypothetical protein [Deinococcus soli (ex Cha et al. 2016)]MDR6328437.1 hypothetical protein [Deinococcus soli (ex Cha et al. 2016)]MDR6753048.1 hypothetical protein [Deinococcus soli (ex Cha et al. 2016)]